ncbi:hypothetical protein RPATATE_0486 [Rickettsia parkeri str. Tate's Hell]|nr:hypothetical protein [Rickettsia parkeri]AFC75223.1 hypothetical protein MC1_05840 [Rickettsia parkeri str. Portsmouth]KJV93946.1 hypothetical protein RPAGB_0516 [Rickettsia parkeri str. Grand Bay]KJV95696.1 hypothetical protein RPAAT24_0438 [Rickettsia parkeri str. AT\
MANRLAEENKDFENYINNIDTVYKKQKVNDSTWFNINDHVNKIPKQNKKKKINIFIYRPLLSRIYKNLSSES